MFSLKRRGERPINCEGEFNSMVIRVFDCEIRKRHKCKKTKWNDPEV